MAVLTIAAMNLRAGFDQPLLSYQVALNLVFMTPTVVKDYFLISTRCTESYIWLLQRAWMMHFQFALLYAGFLSGEVRRLESRWYYCHAQLPNFMAS